MWSEPIVHHVHSGVGGQSHRGGQRKIAFWRRATDVTAAVEVEDGAIGAPGLWLQRITTQPPTDEQVECAIKALDLAMELEKKNGGELVIA